MIKNKDKAQSDYLIVVSQSWTFHRMTSEERKHILLVLEIAKVKGSYKKRWEHLNDIYKSFLDSIGYTPTNWREPETVPTF